MKDLTNADMIKAYADIPQQVIEGFGEEGDLVRQYLLNPTLFALLGEVSGKRILDAGCGQGYLCRLLAKKGAHVTGLEPADAFYAYAYQREQAQPLGIDYLQADLSAWEPVPNTFDAVIASMVLMDIPDYLPALHACVAALKEEASCSFRCCIPVLRSREPPGRPEAMLRCATIFGNERSHSAMAPSSIAP